MNPELINDLHEKFDTIDQSGNGYVSRKDVGEALKTIGFDVPGYQLRELLTRFGDSDKITFAQLNEIYSSLSEEKSAHVNQWKKGIVRVNDAYQVQGIAEHGADEIVHTIRIAEEIAFSSWINDKLGGDSDLKRLLPVEQENGDLYKKVQDGLIICKLINIAQPDTIDERAINKKNLNTYSKLENLVLALTNGLIICKLINIAQPDTIDERAINKKNLNTYSKLENLVLALTSCSAIGCNLVNIDADDISKGKPHLVLGIIWQIIRVGLFSQINLEQVPGMFRLLNEGETLDELRRLSPEQILIRWVNYHLANSSTDRRMNNFTSDIIDSTIYTHLLNQISPREAGLSLSPLNQQGNVKRADELPEEDIVEETREEKTYRNWMNSLGVQPHVGYLFTDLQNGLIIFQLYEEIKKDVVNWKRVVQQFRKLQGMMDQIQNSNYAIELGRDLKFSLVGIQGKDIYDGNRTLTLALVWQLMRAYTLAVLARCTDNGNLATDKEIVRWVNEKLQSAGKSTQIRSFQDPVIADAIVVLDLIDAIKPGVINYDVVQRGGTDQERFDNAKYAITSGRKIGAIIYALPEDITEVNQKMVMTVFACLMARDYMPNVHLNNGSA
uniref:Fimbrin n=1 Tax=Panagrolaimus sp. ES5 TaxID=591445 RepID=A0AC34FGL2_9BILA